MKGICLTSGSDNLFIIRVAGNDFVMCLHNDKNECRSGELLGIIFDQYRT